MFKVFKWLWDKAELHGEQRVLDQLYYLRSYHVHQAELAYFKNKYEPSKDDEDDFKNMFKPKLSPNEHGAVAGELGILISDIESRREAK